MLGVRVGVCGARGVGGGDTCLKSAAAITSAST